MRGETSCPHCKKPVVIIAEAFGEKTYASVITPEQEKGLKAIKLQEVSPNEVTNDPE